MNNRKHTKFYVDSCERCCVPGCGRVCVAMDIMVPAAVGRFCEEHIPQEWDHELRASQWELFGPRRGSGPLLDFDSLPEVKPPQKNVILKQNEIDVLIQTVSIPASPSVDKNAETQADIPKPT